MTNSLIEKTVHHDLFCFRKTWMLINIEICFNKNLNYTDYAHSSLSNHKKYKLDILENVYNLIKSTQ